MIEEKDLETLKLIFVTREECTDTQEEYALKISKTDVRLAVIEQQQKLNNWLTTGIVGGIIALLVKVYLGG